MDGYTLLLAALVGSLVGLAAFGVVEAAGRVRRRATTRRACK